MPKIFKPNRMCFVNSDEIGAIGTMDTTTSETQAVVPPSEQPKPGAGGFVPPAWAPSVLGVLASVLTAIGEAMQLPDHSLPVLIGAAVKALVVGIAAWLGMQSAGPRKA